MGLNNVMAYEGSLDTLNSLIDPCSVCGTNSFKHKLIFEVSKVIRAEHVTWGY